MSDPMKLFCQELVWFDDVERGNYFAVVLAPDEDTAKRMIAAEMLEAGSDNLLELFGHDPDEPMTLDNYYRKHGELGSWGDIGGTACPNCTSHCGRPNGDHIEVDGKTVDKHVCGSCGYEWLPLGFGEKRRELEDAARAQIAQLDEIERQSASDE